MSALKVIFPDQLSKENPLLQEFDASDTLLFYEPIDNFYEISQHKHKLVFLISSFRNLIKSINHKKLIHVKISRGNNTTFLSYLKQIQIENNFSSLYVNKPTDFKTYKDLLFFSQSNNMKIEMLEDKKFISNDDDFIEWSKDKKTTVQEFYYRWLRKKYNVFMDESNKPISGIWNYDKDNRQGAKKIKVAIPSRKKFKPNKITIDVMVDVQECFPSSIGDLENFNWVTTHDEAETLLEDFLDRFLENYGSFQDAISKDDSFLFHSLLSPYLNSGLLDPMQCIESAIKKYDESNGKIPINSVEGFIRQILGWREFIKGVYWDNMPQYKNYNFWEHKLKLNDSWYEGNTGIPPLDDAIKESVNFGYTHHINRLMVIANIMNLVGVHPDNMYKWFMEMYIDAYDWVMVPNVYGMGSFADGGIFSTKPYICGSSYLLRMSNYSKGEWCDIVDGLYWRFINNNIKFFETNPRLSLMTRALEKIDGERKKMIFEKAENFIKNNTH